MTTLENDAAAPGRLKETVSSRLVWDWPVRLFHWSFVATFIGAFVTNRLGVAYLKFTPGAATPS